MALPLPGAIHVPRAPVRIHRARLGGLLRGLRKGRPQARLRTPRSGRAVMEARSSTGELDAGTRLLPTWLLGLLPLLLIAGAIAAFAALDGPGLGERRGPPVEELAV